VSRHRPGALAAIGCTLVLAACGGHAVRASSTPAASAATPGGAAAANVPDGDWLTFDFDSARSGVGPARTGITAGNAAGLRRRTVQLDGTVDSAPVQVHDVLVRGRPRDVVIVTTTYGRTIALDPQTGGRLWEFVPSSISRYQGSYRITTAGPTVDPSRRYVYAQTPDGLVHKLLVASGAQVRTGGWPVRVTFDPTKEKLASPATISGSSLIVVTDGYIGDAPTYQGHIVTIDRGSGRITHVWNSLCSNVRGLIDPPSRCSFSDSAIWGRAGAVVEPDTGRILIATGNGDFNGRTNWGDSVLELSPGLQLLRHWTPDDQQALNDGDTDLGSSEPVVLPRFGGRRLAAQGGKNAKLALLDLDRLYGTRGPAGRRTGGQLGFVATPGGDQLFSAPAVWSHRGSVYVFVADGSGTAAYRLTDPRHPRLAVAWQRGDAGTSPVLAGGLLYVYDYQGGALNVLLPASGHRVASLPAGDGHWNSPIVVGGRVILPIGNANDHATSGTIEIYHLPGR
jgi:hypothetical protein